MVLSTCEVFKRHSKTSVPRLPLALYSSFSIGQRQIIRWIGLEGEERFLIFAGIAATIYDWYDMISAFCQSLPPLLQASSNHWEAAIKCMIR